MSIKAGAVSYQMPEKMAKEYLANRKGQDAKMNPNDYLIKVVNEQYGLLYNCVRVETY